MEHRWPNMYHRTKIIFLYPIKNCSTARCFFFPHHKFRFCSCCHDVKVTESGNAQLVVFTHTMRYSAMVHWVLDYFLYKQENVILVGGVIIHPGKQNFSEILSLVLAVLHSGLLYTVGWNQCIILKVQYVGFNPRNAASLPLPYQGCIRTCTLCRCK